MKNYDRYLAALKNSQKYGFCLRNGKFVRQYYFGLYFCINLKVALLFYIFFVMLTADTAGIKNFVNINWWSEEVCCLLYNCYSVLLIFT